MGIQVITVQEIGFVVPDDNQVDPLVLARQSKFEMLGGTVLVFCNAVSANYSCCSILL